MKKVNSNIIIFSLISIFLIFISIPFGSKKLFVSAESYSAEIVMEVNSKRILHENNSREKKYMASTTKILTALVIINNCNLEDIVTVNKNTVGVEGSSIYLEEGEKLTVKELLYGLMLRSGNDCAETLAVYCSGNIDNFAKLMNQTAKSLGATNSNFVNPHGLHDDNHYTTAYDLALISCEAMKNSNFKEIVSTKSVDISFSTRGYKRHLINKNKMLNEFEGSNGIKTGYTKKAGRCLVSSCIRNGMELVSVVLNCPPMFERSKEILTECFKEYNIYKLVNAENIIGFMRSNNGKSYALTIMNSVELPLKENEYENIKIEYIYEENDKHELKNGQIVGSVKIYCENNLIFEEKIYTI